MDSRLILLLGEGNFSFALFLADKLATSPAGDCTHLIATDFVHKSENDKQTLNGVNDGDLSPLLEQLNLDESIQGNIHKLNSLKIPIWLDVDSTKLEMHEQLGQTVSSGKYSSLTIIFNFPHVHNIKMKINKNRELLRQTFSSIETFLNQYPKLKCKSTVFTSLCYGQSGLNEVEPEDRHRIWPDSWQLTEMAAAGNFILINVIPFGGELVDYLLDNKSNTLKRQFEHNCKSFSDIPVSEFNFNLNSNDTLKETNVHQSFGYRLQNRPFILDKYSKGGNVFQFEVRDDILSSLNKSQPKFFEMPVVRSFTESIEKLIHEKWPNVTIISSTSNDFPTNHYLQFDYISSSDIEFILNQIGEHLSDDLTFKIQNNRLTFGSLECASLVSEKLKLHLEPCLFIYRRLKDVRILYSDFLVEMQSPMSGKKPMLILTTKMLYPRLYNRDVSFWMEKLPDGQENEIDVDWTFAQIAGNLLGANLVSLRLKDRYIKSPLVSSYCFALQIQSLDRALNRWKVAEMLRRLQEQILVKIPNARLR